MRDSVYSAENDDYKIGIFHDQMPIDPREYDHLGTLLCWHSRYSLGDEPDDYLPGSNGEGRYVKSVYDIDNPAQVENDLVESGHVVLPVYMYDHSGITISTTPFRSKWDSGKLGFIYSSKIDDMVKWSLSNPTKGQQWAGRRRIKEEFPECTHAEARYSAQQAEDWVTLGRGALEYDDAGDVTIDVDKVKKFLRVEIDEYDTYVRGAVYIISYMNKNTCGKCSNVSYDIIDSIGNIYDKDLKEAVEDCKPDQIPTDLVNNLREKIYD